LAAYEQLLTEKNGRNTAASRTRQKINNKGVVQSLIEWTLAKSETDGFKALLANGLPEYTGEYLVVKYANRFPEDVVAKRRAALMRMEYLYRRRLRASRHARLLGPSFGM
jgi:hypothetical protein